MDAEHDINIELEYEKLLNVMEECTEDYIFMFDLKRDYYRASKGILERFDLPDYRFNNASFHIGKVVHPEDRDLLTADIERLIAGESVKHNLEYRWIDRDGKITWINCSGKIVDTDSDEKVLIGRIHRLGIRRTADDLTGFLTEAHMKVNYEKFISNNTGLEASSIIFGIDNLKEINQKFGIEGGDRALKYLGTAIKACVDNKNSVYRMDGDKVIARIDGNENCAKEVYKNIKKELDNIITQNDYSIFFTISAGIVQIEDNMPFGELKTKLEFALYQAKKNGRNCAVLYNEDSYKEYMRLLDIQELLRESINNDFEGYEVYYQPIVDSNSGRLLGAEALLRWHCEKYGNMSPGQFIPILEESGLIVPVGKWVAYTAIKQCKEWQKYIQDFKININLSYVQIKKSNVALDVLNLIDQIGIDPKYLTFEFTESGYIENDVSVKKLIKTFNNEGIGMALDDFGTGYSNLSYIQDLNVDIIKIDRSFVTKAMTDENIYSVINHIINMAHSINLLVCIEGIENEEERQKICCLVPDTIQGYLYGRPVPAVQFMQENIMPAI